MREAYAGQHGASERRACRVVGQPRATPRRQLVTQDDKGPLTQAVIYLVTDYGRYDYRRVTARLRHQDWSVIGRNNITTIILFMKYVMIEAIWIRKRAKSTFNQPGN